MPGKKNDSVATGSNIKNTLVSKLPDVFRKFELFNSVIDKSIDTTERDFLSLGENFPWLKSVSGEEVNTAGMISSEISGETLLLKINELKNVLTRIKKFIDETNLRFNEGQNELSNVSKILSDMFDNLSGFKSLVKHLRMLGISTKIESVRLGLEDRGFYNLAEDVEKLSTMITKKSLDIRGKLTYLLNLINNGKTTLTILMRTQNEFTSKIIEESSQNSGLLLKKYKEAAENTGLILSKATEISGEIAEAESSFQFYKNPKQRLEQVKTSLNNLALDSKKKIADIFVSENGGELELIVNFGEVLKKQISQVKDIENEMENHFDSVRNGFKRIEGSISILLSETGQFINSSSFGQNSLLADISKKLLTVTGTIEQDSKISDDMVTSMSLVADTIADLSGFVDEIDEIGTEVELIALNASVKAARTGLEGAALGVLAESIQKLSIDAKNQTALILEVLKNVMKTAEKLRNNFNSTNTGGNKEDLISLSARINEILNSLKSTDSSIFSKVEELKANTSSLNEEIKKTSQRLSTDKKVQNILDVYIRDFQNILSDSLFQGKTEGFNNPDNMFFKASGKDKKKIVNNIPESGFSGKPKYNNKPESKGSNGLRNDIEFV